MHTEEMIKKVGSELRKIRVQNHLTLDELAEKTGVSKLTLGKIERGETNPTLGVMWKITTGLNIPLTKLVSVEPSVSLSKCGEGFSLKGPDEAWKIEFMFQNQMDSTIEMYRAFLTPLATYCPEPHHKGLIEIATVMEGRIEIKIEEELYELKQFDSIKFEGSHVHSYKNLEDRPAVLHLLVKYEQ
ncbi:XRE family transcriptional regulator [Priestia megaterium]|uniref:helix-turn-helix domain-containing protein n=1 Tax=Priestia megaterium TaxID=1404 RepID=UPI000BF4AB17|nr:XRE family transcriptional regulator [Priestia megaterium]RCX25301.1 XRE family transcriptional regulator [Bacillus sp. AG236]MEB2292215.1 XRE family transcriptional regulator [Priestia megaterium]MEE3894756.1 XRE family transcriptional regulator [Priestia megaterium]PEZ13985.1 DNA-binding protein [Priestia megaterium]PFL01954.1 DNA-binding protein [Priestia megaterium]